MLSLRKTVILRAIEEGAQSVEDIAEKFRAERNIALLDSQLTIFEEDEREVSRSYVQQLTVTNEDIERLLRESEFADKWPRK